MGGKEENEFILEYIESLKILDSKDKTDELRFRNKPSIFLNNSHIDMIDGKLIGVRDKYNNLITIENLFSEKEIILNENVYCLYIPQNEILSRNKYQWFSKLSEVEIINCDNNICNNLVKVLNRN